MQKVDFYSGEPSVDGSPPITQNEALIAAAQMQSINQYVQQQKQTNNGYSYDPIARQAMQFPQGGGYSSPFQYQQPYQPMGIGYPAAPSYYNPYYPQQQYFNPYQQMQQSIFDQQPVARTIDIAGYDPSGSEFLFTSEMLDRMEQMKLEYVNKRREIEVQNQSTTNGYNYYGSPFYTGVYFKIRELDSQFYQEIEKIKQEARENRKRFNLNMGRIAHMGSHEKISEDALKERYYGKQIELEAPVVQNLQQEYAEAYRFSNLVEIDTTIPYVNAFNAVRNQHAKYIDPNADAKHAFDNYGLLVAEYEEERQMHEMRNFGKQYESSAYSRLMKKKIMERNGMVAKDDGEFMNAPQSPGFVGYPLNPNMAQFPTLAKNARLADDGTLHITCNFGSHNGEVLSVHNSQEAEYEKDRERFNAFLASIPDANTYRGGG